MRGRLALTLMLDFATAQAAAAQISFSEIPGWDKDDLSAAWQVFHRSCLDIDKRKASFISTRKLDVTLTRVCAEAMKLPQIISKTEASNFFEKHFEPVKLTAMERGLMTGYYEPEFEAALQPSAEFSVPVLRRPLDLVSEVAPPGHPELKAARRLAGGGLAPYPDRRAIEQGALKDQRLEIFWMKDAFELFTMQVQGSGRLRLAGGETVRLAYDGKNGQPYTSVGKVLIDRGILQRGNVSMQAIGAVFKKDPKLAREVMRENKSYVFFRVLKNHDFSEGPLGAQGLALTPLRSIAVDRGIYTYGLPFFIDGALPQKAFRHLVIAQDTGTAIKGEARIDLYVGFGEKAASLAGLLQQRIHLYMLQPKE